MESILNWVKFKAQIQLNKKCSSVKYSKIKGIPKLDDANDAGKFMTHKPLSSAVTAVSADLKDHGLLVRVIWTKNHICILF